MNLGFMEESTMSDPSDFFLEESINSQSTEKSPPEESRSVEYFPMEELLLKPPSPLYPEQAPPVSDSNV